MSDASAIDQVPGTIDWTSEQAQRRVRRRYAADRRLQAYGIIAIALAVGLLGVLVTSLYRRAFPPSSRPRSISRSISIQPRLIPKTLPTATIGRWSARP